MVASPDLAGLCHTAVSFFIFIYECNLLNVNEAVIGWMHVWMCCFIVYFKTFIDFFSYLEKLSAYVGTALFIQLCDTIWLYWQMWCTNCTCI